MFQPAATPLTASPSSTTRWRRTSRSRITAEALGETEIVSLLEENLDDEKQALQQVKKTAGQLTQASATV